MYRVEATARATADDGLAVGRTSRFDLYIWTYRLLIQYGRDDCLRPAQDPRLLRPAPLEDPLARPNSTPDAVARSRSRASALGTAVAVTISVVAASLGSPAMALRPADDGGQSHSAKRACNPLPPDYPGCTTAQINNWEDGDVDAAKAHYPQDRWGQSGFNWSNLGDAHNDKLRRLYNDAVDAYTASRTPVA
jgi:hypothetical protein